MTVLSGQTIRRRGIFDPFCERTRDFGMTYGLGPAGYDVRIAEDILLLPGQFVLASTMEHFDMPVDVIGKVHDKSTWARLGLDVKNTVIEPGWRGYLTLELTNNHAAWRPPFDKLLRAIVDGGGYARTAEGLNRLLQEEREYNARHTLVLQRGMPIAQIVMELTDEPVERPYVGKYMDQQAGAQPAIRE